MDRPRGLPKPLTVLAALVAAAAAAERVWALAHRAPTDFDDAYAYVRYANNWLDGHGLAWNPGGAPLYGVTSLLHFLAVTALRHVWPALGDAAVLQVASGAAALALLAALALACAYCSRSHHLRGNWPVWAAGLVLLLGYGEAFEFHAGTGMDTMLAALANAAVVASSLWLARRPTVYRSAATAAVSFLAVQARPDNLLVALLCPTLALALLAPPPRRRALLVFAGLAGGLLGADVLAKWRLLGTPLPLAFYAKQPGYYGGFAGEFAWNPFWFLGVALAAAWPFLLALVLFAGRASARLLVVLLLPAAVTVAALFSVKQIMGHLGRFYFPLLPLVVFAGALALDGWLAGWPGMLSRREPGRLARALMARVALAALLLAGGARALDAAGRVYAGRASAPNPPASGYEVAAPLPELDSWRAAHEIAELAAAAPPGTRFAMSEHGLPGARARAAIVIDVLGLHDRVFAREGFSAAELWRRRPDVIWLPHPDHTEMLHQILSSPELRRDFVVYPDAFTFGLALRRDSPRVAALATALELRWRSAYPGTRLQDHAARWPDSKYNGRR